MDRTGHLSNKKLIFLTVVSNLSLQVVTALCGFVLPPLVICTFGSSVNGMVSSISQFIAYLNVVEAGVGGASIAALYKPLALKDTSERNAILSATAKFYNRSGLLFTALIFVLSFIYPLIVASEVDRMQASLMVLVLGITGAAEFFLVGKYRVLLTADKKTYVISFVQMIALVVSTTLSVVLIKLGFSILVVKLASALVYLGRYSILSLYVHKRYIGINFHAEPDMKAISQSKNVLVHQIGGLVIFNSPIVMLSIFCSLKDVSVYTIYAMIFSAVSSLLGSFSNGMQSFFGESLVKESIEHTRVIFRKYETFYFAVESWLYAMVVLLIVPFLKIYTANMTDADYIRPEIALLFIAMGIATELRKPYFQLMEASGHYKQTQRQLIVEVILRLVFSFVCTLLFGMKGVLIGGIVSFSYRAIALTIYANKHILKQISFFSFIKCALMFFVALGSVWLIQLKFVEISNLFSLFCSACLYAMLLAIPIAIISVGMMRRIKL